MHVFVPKYKQKLYIIKIKLLSGYTYNFGEQEKDGNMFQMLQLKRLHAFVTRLEIGRTIIH